MKTCESTISFTLIGSGAVRVNPNRGGTSQLIESAGERMLLDCGRGAVENLVKFGFPLESIHRVFISHLHFDHICDLAHFVLLSWVYGANQPVNFSGPEGMQHFIEAGLRQGYTEDIRSRLGHGKDRGRLDWPVHEIEQDGEVYQGDGFSVSVLRTAHGGLPNYNFRFDSGDKRLVITSDTERDERLFEFCQGADLLVAECSGTSEFLSSRPWGTWHLRPETVAELAREARVKKVVMKHLVIEDWSDDPNISEKMAEQIRSRFHGEVIVGYDGLKIDL